MNKNQIKQYLEGLSAVIFSVITENMEEFINRFIKDDDNNKEHVIHELHVNSESLLLFVEVLENDRGWCYQESIPLDELLDWLESKHDDTTEDDPGPLPNAA